jgi:uroporphyrinogen decarboxylase
MATRNMKQWIAQQISCKEKQALPILSFPCVQLLDVSVRDLISDSVLQANGMKAIADRTPTAAAVSFMDLSVEAECFGSSLRVIEGEVPTVVGAIVSTPEEADDLVIPQVGSGRTGLSINTIESAVELITDRPIFAGMIGPFSLAGRLMDVSEAMIYCYDEPEMVHTLMEKVTRFLIDYCSAYKAAGANGVMIAEPLAGLLSPNLAREFAHPYAKQIIDAVQDDDFAVIYHNCGDNAALMTKDIYSLGAAGYHFGDAIDLAAVLPESPKDALIMGNVSPSKQFCNGTPDTITEETHRIMANCSGYPNFVISSGCDIPPLSSWENIDAFFEAVKSFYCV